MVLPQWYHALDALEHNAVTPAQQALGWTDLQRKALFQWFYQHRTSRGRYRDAIPGRRLILDPGGGA